jgi:hypothetical protein
VSFAAAGGKACRLPCRQAANCALSGDNNFRDDLPGAAKNRSKRLKSS